MSKLFQSVDVERESATRESYFVKEQRCEGAFCKKGPYWHLCTPGALTEILFTDRLDYSYGMTLMGMCADTFSQIEIMTYTLMSNHIHVIYSGDSKWADPFLDVFRAKMQRYISNRGRTVDLRFFRGDPIPISNLHSLRNEIVYTNRNGYVSNPSVTPYSYPWGAGQLFFLPSLQNLPSRCFNELSVHEKRKLCHSKKITYSNRLRVRDGMIVPESICDISFGESLFRDAHHYFSLLTKNHEANSQIAKRLSDYIFMTDEEMYSVACMLCSKEYHVSRPLLLSPEGKITVAKRMHYDYHASSGQIRRILKLSEALVRELFPGE